MRSWQIDTFHKRNSENAWKLSPDKTSNKFEGYTPDNRGIYTEALSTPSSKSTATKIRERRKLWRHNDKLEEAVRRVTVVSKKGGRPLHCAHSSLRGGRTHNNCMSNSLLLLLKEKSSRTSTYSFICCCNKSGKKPHEIYSATQKVRDGFNLFTSNNNNF